MLAHPSSMMGHGGAPHGHHQQSPMDVMNPHLQMSHHANSHISSPNHPQPPHHPHQPHGAPMQHPPQGGGAQTAVAPMGSAGPPQVSLALLIEFLVQQTYHELTVLAELLPRKTDMERKVEIFNFASRTRMLFVRLMAVVKWASSASKVDKCVSIMNFCERSANLFMETADMMAKMSRETLVRATLPNFHLPAAVEILTTGSYSKVPRCIRDRIVPPEPITNSEKRQVLQRLTQVIEHRLVTGERLPLQMRNLTIANGRVTFTVPHEFEASLTLMGDMPNIPWKLLNVNILVEDKETGEGKALMHSMQVHHVEQMIQSRLFDIATNPQSTGQPLHDLYNLLHTLCQSLQLEVLYSQTQKLCYERLGNYVRIEEYTSGKCLTVSYWRELMTKDPNSELGYRFSIQIDPHDPARPLMVVHVPPLAEAEAGLAAEQSVNCDHISMERLLVHSIYVRTKSRLGDLKQEVQRRLNLGDVEATLHGSPAVLSIPILQPCLRSEQLLVTIDTHTGVFLAHVPQYEDNPITPEIQQNLNGDRSQLEVLVSQLRHWITKQRVHKTLQQLPATSYDCLPILFDLHKHPLKDLSPNRMYIRLHRQPNAVIIIEFHEKQSNHCEMEYKYYFLWVKPASIEDNPNDDTIIADIPKVYLKALSMIEFDSFLVTHGPSTKVDVQELSEKIIGKRKSGGKVEAPIKRTKFPAYFISDLAHVVSFADERIPFTELGSELTNRGVSHSGVDVEENAIGLVIKLFMFPTVDGVSKAAFERFKKYFLCANVRMQNRNGRYWKLEFVFEGNPVSKLVNKTLNAPGNSNQKSRTGGHKTALHFTYELSNSDDTASKIVDMFIKQWTQMAHLFEIVDELEEYLTCDVADLSHVMGIKSFNYKEVILEYGPGHKQLVSIVWNSETSNFQLLFGGVKELSAMCPHNLVKEQLENHLNTHRNLALLAKILHETYAPLKSISNLPTIPQMGVNQQKMSYPIETFVILPQSPTHIKIVFYNTYCLDVQIKSDGLVYLRDGAISLFDQRKVMEIIQPIQGLKSFLMKYVDETALQRRQSQTEDDNPPSPETIGGTTEGLRFNTPHTPPSNPLTPASPHTNASLGGFLQSPPSIRNPSPATPSTQQPQPSPSGFTVPSPINPGGSVGSPFPSAQSPMAVGSPSVPRPSPRQPGLSPHMSPGPAGINSQSGSKDSASKPVSRLLPQRLWAGAHPTPLTAKKFDEICKECPLPIPCPGFVTPNVILSPLHRFLGSLSLRRQLQHMIRQDESIQALPSNEPTAIVFKVESISCRISCFANNSYQSLHAKLEPDPNMQSHWTPEMLQILEKFFDTRVAVPPFRPHSLTAFVTILQCPIEPLKDIINIMRFDIIPDLVARNSLKWSCRLCLTVPPAAPNIMSLGQPGVYKLNEKMLLFLQLTKVGPPMPNDQEPISVVIPIVYNINLNETTVAKKERMMPQRATSAIFCADQQLSRLQKSNTLNPQRCTLFPSVNDLLANLIWPNDGMQQMNPGEMMPGQQPMMTRPGPPYMAGSGPMMPMPPTSQMGPTPAGGQRMMNPNMVMQQRAQMMGQAQRNPNQF